MWRAIEKKARSTRMRINCLFAANPPTYKWTLLIREIDDEMKGGKFSPDRIYRQI
jgi:hypothetical protein